MAISKQEQIITVFLHRFNRIFMPTLHQLKEKVDKGEELEQEELAFIEQVLIATQDILPKIISHRKYNRIFDGAIQYYHSIINQAQINAQTHGSNGSNSPTEPS